MPHNKWSSSRRNVYALCASPKNGPKIECKWTEACNFLKEPTADRQLSQSPSAIGSDLQCKLRTIPTVPPHECVQSLQPSEERFVAFSSHVNTFLTLFHSSLLPRRQSSGEVARRRSVITLITIVMLKHSVCQYNSPPRHIVTLPSTNASCGSIAIISRSNLWQFYRATPSSISKPIIPLPFNSFRRLSRALQLYATRGFKNIKAHAFTWRRYAVNANMN